MASVFTMIIDGDLPGRFVWRDDRCAAFLTINPIAHGHTLVVPLDEVDHWLDLDPAVNAHLLAVSQRIGQAQMAAFAPERVGLIIAGLEVPHTHLHVIPINSMGDLSFANAQANPDPDRLDQAQTAIVESLKAAGHDPGV